MLCCGRILLTHTYEKDIAISVFKGKRLPCNNAMDQHCGYLLDAVGWLSMLELRRARLCLILELQQVFASDQRGVRGRVEGFRVCR